MYKFLSWTAVILWMALTFYLSHQPAAQSNVLSTGITVLIVDSIEKIASSAEIDIGYLNHFIRKCAHFFNYFMLGILVLHALRRSQVYGYRGMGLALLISVLYAFSDEVHQFFVPGRGPGIKDVFIDSAGAIVGIGAYLVIGRIMRPFKAR